MNPAAPRTRLDRMAQETGNWRTRATCRDYDPEWWFVTGERGRPARQRAQAICRGCPVRAECAAWALRYGIEYGVFGGMTAKERNTQLRRAGVRRRVQPSQRRLSPARPDSPLPTAYFTAHWV